MVEGKKISRYNKLNILIHLSYPSASVNTVMAISLNVHLVLNYHICLIGQGEIYSSASTQTSIFTSKPEMQTSLTISLAAVIYTRQTTYCRQELGDKKSPGQYSSIFGRINIPCDGRPLQNRKQKHLVIILIYVCS